MAALPKDERAELEEAAAFLRRVRADGDHKLLPLTVVSKNGREMAARTPAEVLAESRRRTSLLKRQRVLDTIRLMLDDGEPISIAAVARAAKVSTWLVYAEGVREHVQAAIQRQGQAPVSAAAQGRRERPAGLHADLAMARKEIKELRAERDQLRIAMRQQLGHQLDQISNRKLTERITELTAVNRRLEHGLAQFRPLADYVNERDRDLASARTGCGR
ncbi:DUF6262 family protein [Streptomyces sp. NBC_01591]|uniref:DUF6262 family protein n=1 Tax=Streptomyces sp. NBC_01591 TaxID=2975888 RepID=UPI002DD9A428|nr:DUF6262 family protein [Streptomyces sp. NBC_01591]WSD72119.1 DUF6262 family protein [Streptomyces sp. NBC_01591]